MARNNDYAMLQILAEAHTALKHYCDSRGYKMGKFVSNLILHEIQHSTKQPSKRVLPTGKPPS
jgi:hypothetical protein